MYETEWSQDEKEGCRGRSEKASNARSAAKGSLMDADTLISFLDSPSSIRSALGIISEDWLPRSLACRSRSSMSTPSVVVISSALVETSIDNDDNDGGC